MSGKRKILLINSIAIAIFILISMYPDKLQLYDKQDFVAFHMILEMVSIVISFSIFFIGWKLYSHSLSFLLLSITFLMVGSIDFFHTLSYLGMPHFIMDSSITKSIWLWVIARLFCALLVLLIFSIDDRRISKNIANFLLPLALLTVTSTVFIIYRFESGLPMMVIEGVGPTTLKNGIEYFISFIYLILFFLSYRYYKNKSDYYSINIFISLSLMVLSELNFTLYNSIYDIHNFYGHLLKAVAYFYILEAFYFATMEQRKKGHEKVITAKNELSGILSLQDGMIFKFQKEGDRFIHSLCEGELLEVLNIKKEWIIGKPLEAVRLPNLPEIMENYKLAWYGKRRLTYEITFKNRQLYVSLKPVLKEGKVIEVIGSMTDVTDLKAMEQAFINSEKLGVVGEMAAGVAHEIRNPLTTIKGFMQLMKKDAVDKHRTYFDLMLSEVDRLESITRDFMAIAKPQASHFKPASLSAIIDEVISFLNPQAVLKGIDIVFMDTSSNLFIKCDSNQLKQVLINLIKNAFEAMPKGGTIHIILTEEVSQLTLEIKDEGTGIPLEILESLGRPFLTTKKEGYGLGLMMSQKIIEAHNGKMRVASVLNSGTSFFITLPCLVRDDEHTS
ncbi:MASE3 domain-containing protein [Mesobacillus jeotgali]|uniref:MASE3 domain-containing protein n=1 Tax=Mesobacillus jeotgali TaxID=129985 RepID=UPI001591EABB|nr:MASE3 domain-containing protein [Mesobacillus jeotgali]